MIEVADILRQHGADYLQEHAVLPNQQRALRDIQGCRTAYFGGHVMQCDHCGLLCYAYHSCRNRHCPKCHGEQADIWLERQQTHLLPTPHYLLTFTLPAELRSLAYGQQKPIYSALLRCAAAALLKLAQDPRWLGATSTILAVLHTWTRAMLYHPHVHLLVSAGGLSPDGQRWLNPNHPAFLVPVRALSIIFRANLGAAFKKLHLLDQAPATVWKKPWVVHCQHAGSGTKVLEYLARYVFRVAITNSRIESFQDGRVTFRFRDNRTQQLQRVCLPAADFIGRFLKHVLPRGFSKVRHYGLASTARAKDRDRARELLAPVTASLPANKTPRPTKANPAMTTEPSPQCPHCHKGHLLVIQTLPPTRKIPP